jgi:hypothetical protein
MIDNLTQVYSCKMNPCKRNSAQIHLLQGCPLQVHPAEVRPSQVCRPQIDWSVWILLSSSMPTLFSLLKKVENRLICHITLDSVFCSSKDERVCYQILDFIPEEVVHPTSA